MSFWDRPNVVDNLTVLSSITEPGWGLKMGLPVPSERSARGLPDRWPHR